MGELGRATGEALGPLPPQGVPPVQRPQTFDPSADQKLQQGAVARPKTFGGEMAAELDQIDQSFGRANDMPSVAPNGGMALDGQQAAPVSAKQSFFDKIKASQGTGFKSELGAGLVAGSMAAAGSGAQTNGELLSSFFAGMGSGMYTKKLSNKQGEGMAALAEEFGLPPGIVRMAKDNPEMFGKIFPDLYKANALKSGGFTLGKDQFGNDELRPISMGNPEKTANELSKSAPDVYKDLQERTRAAVTADNLSDQLVNAVNSTGSIFQTGGGFGDLMNEVGNVIGSDLIKSVLSEKLNVLSVEEAERKFGKDQARALLEAGSMEKILEFIQKTKGAISEREMDLFRAATLNLNRTKAQNMALALGYKAASMREREFVNWVNRAAEQEAQAGRAVTADWYARKEFEWEQAVSELDKSGKWDIYNKISENDFTTWGAKDEIIVNPFTGERRSVGKASGARQEEQPQEQRAPQGPRSVDGDMDAILYGGG